MGIDPLPYSLRQLHWMAIGKQRADWDRTASLIHYTLSVYGEKRPPSAFHPFRQHEAAARTHNRLPDGVSAFEMFREAGLKPIKEKVVMATKDKPTNG